MGSKTEQLNKEVNGIVSQQGQRLIFSNENLKEKIQQISLEYKMSTLQKLKNVETKILEQFEEDKKIAKKVKVGIKRKKHTWQNLKIEEVNEKLDAVDRLNYY